MTTAHRRGIGVVADACDRCVTVKGLVGTGPNSRTEQNRLVSRYEFRYLKVSTKPLERQPSGPSALLCHLTCSYPRSRRKRFMNTNIGTSDGLNVYRELINKEAAGNANW